MRLVPKSLAGQLITLLLLGLLGSHWLAQNLNGKTRGSIHELARGQIVERYTTAYRVLATCRAACDRAALVAALESGDARFFFAAASEPTPPMSNDETRLASAVVAGLGRHDAEAVRVRLQRDANDASAARPLKVAISAALPDGALLVGVMWPVVRGGWWHWFAHGMFESYAVVLILAGVFVGRVRRPLRAISAAYEHVSRGEKVAPLTADGPRELREVVASFNVMQERLARFVGDRTRMMAAISHDFRMPITSLRLRVEMVDDRQLRQAMTRTLEEMRQMVDETLVFARQDNLTEESRTVDLARLLVALVDEQKALGRDVRLQEAVASPYRCRPLALKRAIANLVDNAVRYGERARMALEIAPGGVRITIEDDGPGVPEGCSSELFRPFVRIGRDRGGVGLGLAIARSCVQAHGGHIDLESRQEGGLRAIIQLPA